MSETTPVPAMPDKPAVLDNPWIRIPLIGLSCALFGVVLFWPAGRLDWVQGWIYLGLIVAALVSSGLILQRVNPEVLTWRRRIGTNTKSWDRAWLPAYRIASLGVMVVAALDAARYGWAPMSVWLMPVGFLAFLAGIALAVWAMAVNAHFEGTVRIQHDRGHQVIETGPYALVRHPGYAGIILVTLGTPFLLGSWWAMVPALAIIPLVALRTWLEDRTLQAELAGYSEFAGRTRYRLVPGVW